MREFFSQIQTLHSGEIRLIAIAAARPDAPPPLIKISVSLVFDAMHGRRNSTAT